jgi:hypothetical protein
MTALASDLLNRSPRHSRRHRAHHPYGRSRGNKTSGYERQGSTRDVFDSDADDSDSDDSDLDSMMDVVNSPPPRYRGRSSPKDDYVMKSPTARRTSRREMSPAPAFDDEIPAFVRDFEAKKTYRVDLLADLLWACHYTPEILAWPNMISYKDLAEHLSIKPGIAAAIKGHARVWWKRLVYKRKALGIIQ